MFFGPKHINFFNSCSLTVTYRHLGTGTVPLRSKIYLLYLLLLAAKRQEKYFAVSEKICVAEIRYIIGTCPLILLRNEINRNLPEVLIRSVEDSDLSWICIQQLCRSGSAFRMQIRIQTARLSSKIPV